MFHSIFKVQFHACPILNKKYAFQMKYILCSAIVGLLGFFFASFSSYGTKKKMLCVCLIHTLQRRAYFQAAEEMPTNFCWHLMLVSFEMNLVEWLKALILFHFTFYRVFSTFSWISLLFLCVCLCSFFCRLLFVSSITAPCPKFFRICLSIIAVQGNACMVFVAEPFFFSLIFLPVWSSFLFGRFMACLRAIYINTWYMKIKLCNKICRQSTVMPLFGSCFRCKHLPLMLLCVRGLYPNVSACCSFGSNCWYQRFSYLFHFI